MVFNYASVCKTLLKLFLPIVLRNMHDFALFLSIYLTHLINSSFTDGFMNPLMITFESFAFISTQVSIISLLESKVMFVICCKNPNFSFEI